MILRKVKEGDESTAVSKPYAQNPLVDCWRILPSQIAPHRRTLWVFVCTQVISQWMRWTANPFSNRKRTEYQHLLLVAVLQEYIRCTWLQIMLLRDFRLKQLSLWDNSKQWWCCLSWFLFACLLAFVFPVVKSKDKDAKTILLFPFFWRRASKSRLLVLFHKVQGH